MNELPIWAQWIGWVFAGLFVTGLGIGVYEAFTSDSY